MQKITISDIQNIRFEQVKGVGTIDLKLDKDERVYTFIGENGIGKTKLLECLFTLLFFSQRLIKNKEANIFPKNFPFKSVILKNNKIEIGPQGYWCGTNNLFENIEHNLPIVYVSAQHRGYIGEHKTEIKQLGNRSQRLDEYISYLLNIFNYAPEKLKQLNMDVSLEEWIIQRAQSANPYQSKEDNRQVELTTLSTLLNKIDQRIDPEFLEISGDNRVFIKIENQKRELSELSSGFTSILKILQAIIAGYSYFTNENHIANVKGIVLIDEIESHLHNQWQANIIPLLKELFPNTTFLVTTHSSLVISQLQQGEAYRLQRSQEDSIVYSNLIEEPSKVSFIDLLQDAFGVDLNQLKIKRAEKDGQKEAKKALLKLVQQELNNLEEMNG